MKKYLWFVFLLFLQTQAFSAASRPSGQTYVAAWDVVFVRDDPGKRFPQEDLTYQQLEKMELEKIPPRYLIYGQNVTGATETAHPGCVRVRFLMNGKEETGYVDAKKVWLEPDLGPVEYPRFQCAGGKTAVYLLPQSKSRVVLELQQGEVVNAVGQLTIGGAQWIKAQFESATMGLSTFSPEEMVRYGYVPAGDLRSLLPEKVDQSKVDMEEVPEAIRGSTLSFPLQQRRRLSQQGFYIDRIPPLQDLVTDDMADQYQQEDAGSQFFITSDLYLHTFHLLFDRMLQDLEEHKFFPVVRRMAAALARQAEQEWKTKSGSLPLIQDALLADLLYFSVAARLLDPGFIPPQPVASDVNALVDRIGKAEGPLPALKNKIDLGEEDFTQYRVRGHYEINETLQRYFRGMMWFGRRAFLLSSDTQTVSAILIPGLVKDSGMMKSFTELDSTLAYLVGEEDNYSLSGYMLVNKEVFGTETPAPEQISDQKIAEFRKRTVALLPAQKIVSVQTGIGKTPEERLSSTSGFKFLGQRYTWDAYIFSQLTSPSVGTDENPRNLPSALDAMMILGSRAAKNVQDEAQQKHRWNNYETQTEKVAEEIHGLLNKRSGFYENWLYTLSVLFLPAQSKQMFALKEPWQYKSLNAGLGSWTELKHDTILYSKQSYAEMGAEGEELAPAYQVPNPKGYVEPNPVFFQQVVDLSGQILEKLKAAGLITDEYIDKWQTYKSLAQKALEISGKEVDGKPITPEDYRWIQEMHFSFDRALLLPRDSGDIIEPEYLRMALVADVATDAVGGKVLEVGSGVPQRIVVLVKDSYGGTRLTVGYVYSWYEFAAEKRWTDKEWKQVILGPEKEQLRQGIVPPAWYSKLNE